MLINLIVYFLTLEGGPVAGQPFVPGSQLYRCGLDAGEQSGMRRSSDFFGGQERQLEEM
jgi:hypothetical protein